jgi:hypothetical protein
VRHSLTSVQADATLISAHFANAARARRIQARDSGPLAAVMEHQKLAWEPGSRQAYHAVTLGFYEQSWPLIRQDGST